MARYAKAGSRVGVVGIGGLGHMALQYARVRARGAPALPCVPLLVQCVTEAPGDGRSDGGDYDVAGEGTSPAALLRVTDGRFCFWP